MLTELGNSIFSNNTTPLAMIGNSGVLLLVAAISYFLFHTLLNYAARRLEQNKSSFISTLSNNAVIKNVARIIPFIIIQLGVGLIPNLPEAFSSVVRNVATALTILYGMLTLTAYINAIIAYFEQKDDMRMRSVKSYAQLTQLLIFILGAICIIGALIDRSPVILLSGLGAMSAIGMLVFKDTILSFVAGVQLSSNNILRVGDWIEMPQVGADGDVIDIALQIVKVQNWDKTIVSIPTWRFMQESFKNWRGMRESGGRRISRSIFIDVTSVSFLSNDDIERLKHIRVLRDYLSDKQNEIEVYNGNLGNDATSEINQRRLTNVGTFRAYTLAYLRTNPRINQSMTCMVRQLAPTPEGIPLQVYCFTNTTVWVEYEGIQGDIFDHLFSVLPEFGLRAYQQPSGHDLSLLTKS